MMNCLIVGLGGLIGSVCRYLISLIPLKESTVFPMKTFFINIIGCLAIGIIAVVITKNPTINPKLIMLCKVGICGGFTTFSTFALETMELMNHGHGGIAIIYVILSVIIGIAVIFGVQIIFNR